MVGYRDFAQRVAKKYNVVGWVKNKDDGTVEIVAQGILDDLKGFIEELNSGSVLAEVTSVDVEWRTGKEHFNDFIVIY